MLYQGICKGLMDADLTPIRLPASARHSAPLKEGYKEG